MPAPKTILLNAVLFNTLLEKAQHVATLKTTRIKLPSVFHIEMAVRAYQFKSRTVVWCACVQLKLLRGKED
jgi:hypothetical protein